MHWLDGGNTALRITSPPERAMKLGLSAYNSYVTEQCPDGGTSPIKWPVVNWQRNRQKLFERLRDLPSARGWIYALELILAEQHTHDLNRYGSRNNGNRIQNTGEVSFGAEHTGECSWWKRAKNYRGWPTEYFLLNTFKSLVTFGIIWWLNMNNLEFLEGCMIYGGDIWLDVFGRVFVWSVVWTFNSLSELIVI